MGKEGALLEKHCWREVGGCVQGRERGKQRSVRRLESWTTAGWDIVEEKEQQRQRRDGSKALWRSEERGGASDPWPREEPSQQVMYLD